MSRAITRTLRGLRGTLQLDAFFDKLRRENLIDHAEFTGWIYPEEASFEVTLCEGVEPDQITAAIRLEEHGCEASLPEVDNVEAAFDALEKLKVACAEYQLSGVEFDRVSRRGGVSGCLAGEQYYRTTDATEAVINAASNLVANNEVYSLIYLSLRVQK